MLDDDEGVTNREILGELRRISKLITLSNAERLEQELSRIATTEERRRIWVKINGERSQDLMAKELGINRRTVNRFVVVLEAADLVETIRGGPPKRIVNYVPPGWVDLIESNEPEPASAVSSTQPVVVDKANSQ